MYSNILQIKLFVVINKVIVILKLNTIIGEKVHRPIQKILYIHVLYK